MKNIKGYEPLKQIGTGGFGEVYVARQDVINREVAIKVILPLYANRDDFIKRFQLEAELVAKLENPHIVPLYDYWRDPSGAYLVMRYIKGGNLADHLVTSGALDIKAAARLLEQIAGALHTAHRNRVIHQDIKPANILLDEDGNAYLTDFGIARDIESNVNLAEDESNTMHGSPKYISPEHLRRKEITPRSDIYSLGILMYEVLTGNAPFEHDDMLQLLQMHVRKDLPSLQENAPNLPEALNYPLQQATLKDPMARYESVLHFAQDFTAIVTNLDKDQTGTIPFPSTWNIDSTSKIELRNPYKGLKAFKETDAEDFYGREELVKSLIQSMTANGKHSRFLAVVGPSGSGKSSVVRAGLIPAIRKGEIEGLPQPYISTMIPGANPMRSLEGAILKVASRATVSLMETISQNHYDLTEVLKNALPEDGEMLLLLDQFEEIFTLIDDEDKRRNFLDIIYDALNAPDSRLRVIATLRADFLGHPLSYPDWGVLFRERVELIPAMTQAELRASIEEPATKSGLSFESGLVGIIMGDVNSQVGVLPLLQYTLSELYDRRNGIELTLAAYEEMGGITGAMKNRADEIYNTLNLEKQEIAQILFTRLVRVGDGEDNTRQRVLLEDIYSIERNEQAIRNTVDTFGKYRLLTFSTNDTTSRQPTVEIAHEALIRNWDLLKGWIEDNVDALRLQARLSNEARQWQSQNNDKSYLARGMQLQQFTALKDNMIIALTQSEQAYLDASLREDRSRKQRARSRRLIVLGLQIMVAIAGVLAIFFGIAALIQRNDAIQARDAEQVARIAEEEARALADANALESRARELAASSLLFAEEAPDRAILLSLESLAIENTFEGRNALLSSVLTQSRLAGYFNGHTATIRAVTTSNDGTLIATAASDGTVIIWDALSRDIIFELSEHSSRVNSLSFNPDSSRLASAALDGTVIVWDTATGDILHQLNSDDNEEIRAIAFSPDGKLLATGNSNGQILLWASDDDFSQIGFIEAHDGGVIYDLTFSPDGTIMATGGEDNTIHLWDTQDNLSLRQVIPAHTDWVLTLDFSPDGQFLASGSVDRSVRLWDVATGENEWAFVTHRSEVFSLSYADNGQIIVSSDLDGNIVLWQASDGAVQSSFRTFPPFSVRALADNANSLYIAGDNAALLEVNIGFVPRFGETITTSNEEVLTIATHLDGTIAYAGGVGEDYAIYLTQPNGQQQILDFHERSVMGLAWSAERLISVSIDRQVGVWSNGELTGSFTASDSIFAVAVHDNLVALALNNRNIEIWNISGEPDTWSLISTLTGHSNRINTIDFNADGTQLASGSLDETVIIWDVTTAEALFDPLIGHTDSVETVRFSPDGSTIASGSRDTNIILWDAQLGEAIGPALERHENWVTDIAFSPTANLMVSVSGDRSVILWDTQEQRAFELPFFGHRDWVNTVAFAADGNSFLTAGRDLSIIRWQNNLDRWSQTACDIVNRDLTAGEIRDFFNETYPPSNVCVES